MHKFKRADRVRLLEVAFERQTFERYPWLKVIGRCIGWVGRVSEASCNSVLVEWPQHNEKCWVHSDELELYSPKPPRYSVGQKVSINKHIIEEADISVDSNAGGVGAIVEVHPNKICQYWVRFSPNGRIFKMQEAELDLCE